MNEQTKATFSELLDALIEKFERIEKQFVQIEERLKKLEENHE
jgi:uncharacterized protein (UPF0335 family)